MPLLNGKINKVAEILCWKKRMIKFKINCKNARYVTN